MMKTRHSLIIGLIAALLWAWGCDATPTAPTVPPAQPVAAAPEAGAASAPATPTPANPEEDDQLPAPDAVPEYVEQWIGGAKAGDDVPMIVAIHGLGDKPETFGRLFEAYPQPARLILPRGFRALDMGHSWFRVKRADDGALGNQPGIEASADAVARLVTRLTQEHPQKIKPVVTGFSQGGILCWALAVRHPDLFSAIFPIAGGLPTAMKVPPARTPTIVAFHGEADGRIAFGPTRDMAEAWKAAGLPVEIRGFSGVAHHTTSPMRTALYDAITAATRPPAP